MPRKCASVADAPVPLPLGELSRGVARCVTRVRACGARLYTQLTAPVPDQGNVTDRVRRSSRINLTSPSLQIP